MSSRNGQNVSRFGGALGIIAVMWSTPSAIAEITNTVTATGTPIRGQLRATQAITNVPVETAMGRLVVTQEPGGITGKHGVDPTLVDGGDYIWFRVVMKNEGNAPLSGVRPDVGIPNFDSLPGTGEPPKVVLDPNLSTAQSPDLLQPGERLVYVVSYMFSDLDVLRGARDPDGFEYLAGGLANESPEYENSRGRYLIPADPHLLVSNHVVLEELAGRIGDGRAAIGDLVHYTFTVENVGNVAIQDVTLLDIHEEHDPHRIDLVSTEHMRNETFVRDGLMGQEAPSLDRVQDGSWDLLQPGAVINFTYTRQISHAEFYAQ